MLKTNSRKAIDNIREYIINNSCFDNYYNLSKLETLKSENAAISIFPIIAKNIYDIFIHEYWNNENSKRYYKTEFCAFENWLYGLPSVLDCKYLYGCCAVELAGEMLQETEKEKERFSEEEAEKLLNKLIYREIKKVVEN